tara:strand:- start:206 stop:352 length:147 start_codon:yes stop_codon:yes gene_type:complete
MKEIFVFLARYPKRGGIFYGKSNRSFSVVMIDDIQRVRKAPFFFEVNP